VSARKAELGLAKLTSINNEGCCVAHCLCFRSGVYPGLPSTSSLDVLFPFTGDINVLTVLVVHSNVNSTKLCIVED
jgi:hypothetical protein